MNVLKALFLSISLMLAHSVFPQVGSNGQVEIVQFELEKTPFKFNLNAGPYRSRLVPEQTKKTGLINLRFLCKFIFHSKGPWILHPILKEEIVIQITMTDYLLFVQLLFFISLIKEETALV